MALSDIIYTGNSYDTQPRSKKTYLIQQYIKNMEIGKGIPMDITEPEYGHIYKGDFFGLLKKIKIVEKMHLPILLVNNLKSPMDFDGDISGLLTYSEVQMKKITVFLELSDGYTI